MKIIILAGGGGTRLFPVSVNEKPKQFMKISNEESILVNTVKRFFSVVENKDIVIITGEKYYGLVKEDLKSAKIEGINILCEPEAKGTAPAIAYAAKYCSEVLGCSDNEILFIAPADHVIGDNKAFKEDIDYAVQIARAKEAIVLFGIRPTFPETGFGYIETGEMIGEAFKALSFKEKPNRETAIEYLSAGNYYWNAGMFVFTIGKLWQELARTSPYMFALGARGLDFMKREFYNMPNISFDYAVAEKSQEIVLIPFGTTWSDIGSWDALYDFLPKDEDGNAVKGESFLIDSKNNLLYGREGHLIIGAGIEDLMIISTENITMLLKKGNSQKVKEIYEAIAEK